jgi:type I restriction enzyme S subunit
MTEELRPYPEYKESGLPWLGKVPEHWGLRKLRGILKEVTERNRPDLPLLSVVREKGVIVRDVTSKDENYNFIPDDLTNYKVVRKGHFAINKMKAWQGSYGVSRHDGIVSPAYFVFNIDGVGGDYFHAAIRSKAYVPFFTQASDGVRIGQWDLSKPRMREIPFAIPTPSEQDAIVGFLRGFEVKVRRFIRNRRRLIEVLNEQKQAIVNRAVTLGLDPNAPLKPSGVEWIGDIPKHWEERRLRNLTELRVSNVDKHSKDGEIPVRLCNYTDVYKNSVITTDMPFMAASATSEEIATFNIRVGDVIITKDSEDWRDIGVPAVVAQTADDLVCGYHLAILRPKTDFISGCFLFYALQCRSAVIQLNLAAKGVTRFGLSQGAIKSLSLAVPTMDEQEKIVLFIEDATVSLNGLINRAQREIDLIREYRTRLITDVVTGKLDVRYLSPDIGEELAEPVDLDEGIEDEEPLEDEEPEFDEETGE